LHVFRNGHLSVTRTTGIIGYLSLLACGEFPFFSGFFSQSLYFLNVAGVFPWFPRFGAAQSPNAGRSPVMPRKQVKPSPSSLNETGNRKSGDRRSQNVPVAGNRRKAPRRRQIDPTTCEREYSDSEIEFMQALDEYKRRNGRMFPTCSEILEVLTGLGYEKRTDPGCTSLEVAEAAVSTALNNG
jgi:hypothetical protein